MPTREEQERLYAEQMGRDALERQRKLASRCRCEALRRKLTAARVPVSTTPTGHVVGCPSG